MKSLICDRCGSVDIGYEHPFYVCQHCGTRFALDGDEYRTAHPEEGRTVYVHVPQPQPSVPAYSPKNKLAALLLAIFGGYLGIHRFYVGKVGTGLLWFFTGGMFCIGWLVDIILIAVGSFTDSLGRPLLM